MGLANRLQDCIRFAKEASMVYIKEDKVDLACTVCAEAADRCVGQSQYENAIELLQIVVETTPKSNYRARAFSKIAECLARMGNYEAAIDTFEHAAEIHNHNGGLWKYLVGDLYFQAGLCALCLDPDIAWKYADKLHELGKNNSVFFYQVIQACEDNDVDRFYEAVQNLGCRNNLTSNLLLRIKQHINLR